jgi:hypothetical protein
VLFSSTLAEVMQSNNDKIVTDMHTTPRFSKINASFIIKPPSSVRFRLLIKLDSICVLWQQSFIAS